MVILFILVYYRRILTMKKLNTNRVFLAFAVLGTMVTIAIVNLLGLDYWNWPVIQSTDMAVIETAENLEMGAMVNIAFISFLFIVAAPIVATVAVDFYYSEHHK